MSSHHYENRRERQHRYSDESRTMNKMAGQLRQTASFDYNEGRNNYQNEKENEKYLRHEYERSSKSRKNQERSLQEDYSRAMSQMNRSDYGPVHQRKSKSTGSKSHRSTEEDVFEPRLQKRSNGLSRDRRASQSTATTSSNSVMTSKPVEIQVKKRSVSKKDPSEEIIAVFGGYGVTGSHFLQKAIDAGYNVKAMILPGMEMEDVSSCQSLRLYTGTLDEVDKVQEVVKDATYVVCLLSDCDDENFNPPVGNEEEAGSYDFQKLNFVHNLVPMLEHSGKCRVLLYQASSLSKGNQGTPLLSTMVKKMAFSKEWKDKKREQDQIAKYLMHETKNMHFNYIVTRPSDLIWDKPSRKKLAASKSQPGPFPITNSDLADFTLEALKMQKIYNSCPFVVQDGI